MTKTISLFDHEPYERSFHAAVVEVKDDLVALDRSLFYPSGGGQPGDLGMLNIEGERTFRVIETFRDEVDRSLIWHRLETPVDPRQCGGAISGEIDWDLRYRNMQMHTCLHLLCAVIPAQVTGCNMGAGKGRLDFDLPEMALTKNDISRRVNEMIGDRVPVTTSLVAVENYESLLGLVRNRYAVPPKTTEAIKVIEVAGVDIQPCGGTHVANTFEIPEILCEKIEKKGRQNRRIVLRFVD
jgi:misacylated tRNA(Ala) deacylase